MSNSKTIIEAIKTSLFNDETLSSILIKFQLFAQELNSPELLKWVLCELNGYADTDPIPEYRRIGVADIKAEVLDTLGCYHKLQIPLGLDFSESYALQLYSSAFCQSIAELEDMHAQIAKNPNYRPQRDLSAVMFDELEPYIHGEFSSISRVIQTFPSTSIASIILSIKSQLMSYLKQIDNDFNFAALCDEATPSQTSQQHQIPISYQFNYCPINAVNTGSGIINTNSNNTVIGANSSITINDNDLSKLSELWKELDKIKANINEDSDELAQYLIELKSEIDNKISCPSAVKKTLRAIKSLISKAGEVAIEHGIDQCINIMSNYV